MLATLLQALLASAISLPLALLLGGPLGVLRYQLERTSGSRLAQAVRALTSLPLILALLALSPALGDASGNRPLALALAAIPFFARLVASSLRVVPRGLVEAAHAMGASPLQIVTRVLLREARPALAVATALLAVSLLAGQGMVSFQSMG